jgi:phage-related minor tail protein
MSDTDEEGRVDALSGQMERLNGLTEQFGRVLSRSLSQGIVQGKSFEDILRNIGQRFLDIALRSAFKPLEGMISGLGQSLIGGLGGLLTGGATGAPLNITPFAEGGVVSAPGLFPLGRGLGLMGERGAEAILPLARGPDGRLGVANAGAGRSIAVTMHVSTPDAESFRRSEAQLGAALARAVSRGSRAL